ncbi:partial Riboflavin-binding protein RibY, partial [Anaerolineae bacterium]
TNPPTEAPTAAPTIAVTTAATETPAGELVKVTLFLGYIPNIQFAPVYMAFDQGFFKANGIDLTIEHGFDETDGLTRIASGKLDFGMISGEQVLLARSQGAAVKDIYRWYQKFPVGIVSLAKNNISKPEDLKGKKIGVPGLYGASYVGLQALLNAASLTEADLGSLEAIGFEPVPLICEGKIDASVVYISNEPAQIEKTCGAVNVIAISEYANIVSNGLVTSEKMLSDNPDLARRMVAAFDQGLAAVIADPELAYTVSRKYVETLSEDDSVQREVLAKSIEMWKAETLGISDPEVWKRTAETLVKMGLLPALPEVESAYSGEYLPK